MAEEEDEEEEEEDDDDADVCCRGDDDLEEDMVRAWFLAMIASSSSYVSMITETLGLGEVSGNATPSPRSM